MSTAAIAGCGVVGRKRALALSELGVSVGAVFDIDRSRAESLAKELGQGSTVASDAQAAFSSGDVDLAVVASNHASLAELALTAIDHGCHVVVEKPGATRVADLEAVAKAGAKANRIVRVGFNHRFHPSIIKARQLIADGQAGDIMHIRARYGHG
ncbi:MAG: Gfo/Idh/MocA family oxidoreductase, partial [Acidimicrobiia bacterium]|nr:Gfo/Idh/MocA family oxidoreductase [Acidimicrobiia bacterium]